MTILKITAFILICIPVNLYAQEIYKWVDAKGNVTYSRKAPPKGQKEAKIETIRSIKVTQPKSSTQYEFKSNSSIPTQYHNPYENSTPLRQRNSRTAEQEAERQALLRAASTPYQGARGLTANQLRTQAALQGINVSSGDSYTNLNNSYSAPMSQRQQSTITNCDSSGCWGSDGTRYNKGAGETYFPSTGGVCQGVGGQMQCN